MEKLIKCSDGAVIRGKDDDDLVASLEAHVLEAHPDLVGVFSRAEIVAMAARQDEMGTKHGEKGAKIRKRQRQGAAS
jgi:hypothetical protein